MLNHDLVIKTYWNLKYLNVRSKKYIIIVAMVILFLFVIFLYFSMFFIIEGILIEVVLSFNI